MGGVIGLGLGTMAELPLVGHLLIVQDGVSTAEAGSFHGLLRAVDLRNWFPGNSSHFLRPVGL